MNLSLWKKILSRHQKRVSASRKRYRRKFRRAVLESMESRQLMATINYNIPDPDSYVSNPNGLLDGDIDLTLRIANVGNVAIMQLVDMDAAVGGLVVGSSPFSESIVVNITGYSTNIDGKIEEFPETLLVDFALPAGLNPSAVSVDVTLNGIDGTLVSLLQDDVLTINPSSSSVYQPASFSATLNDGELIDVRGMLLASGSVALTSNEGGIEVPSSGSILGGDIQLQSTSTVNLQGEADSLDALVLLSPSIGIHGGVLIGNQITIGTIASANVSIQATDLRDGQFSIGEVAAMSTSSIVVDGSSQISAGTDLVILASANINTQVIRGAQDDGDSNDDDRDQDAALAASVVESNVSVAISDSANLTADGNVSIDASHFVNVLTTADGTLSNGKAGGDEAGGTLATATLLGNTDLLIDGNVSINANGNLYLGASSNRSVTTTSIATPNGATEDGDVNTQTEGQTALANNNASTSDGAMTLAAAIAVNTVTGETRARVNGGSLSAINGTIDIHSSAIHNVQTIADGTSATGANGTGVGVAVAIGLSGVTDPNGVTGLSSLASVAGNVTLNASSVHILADTPSSMFETHAESGPSGPSKDANGNSTGSDVGVAGALAIGLTITVTNAETAPGSVIDTQGSHLTIYAQASTNSLVEAIPKRDPISGEDLALGAGVAINITDHETLAAISDAATVTGVKDLQVTSTSFHGMNTTGKAGAEGGTAIAAAVAYEMGHNDTIATIGTGSQLNASSVNVTAVHAASDHATSMGNASGLEASIGAAFSMSYLEARTEATIKRNLVSQGDVSIVAVGSTNTSTTSTASAQGEVDNGASDDPKQQSQNQRNAVDSQATSRGARGSDINKKTPDASTAEGDLTVAAAISVDLTHAKVRAAIEDNIALVAGGSVLISATANTNSASTADGSANQSKDAIGAAVAINATKSSNEATVGTGTNVTSDGLIIKAIINDAIDKQAATATSGSSGQGLGVAGALTINLTESRTQALVKPNASITLADGFDTGSNNGSVHIEALSFTENKATAQAAASGKTGVGASIAFNIADQDSVAEIGENAQVIGAHDARILSSSKHDVITNAVGGAKGGTAITPVASATLAFPTTTARLASNINSLTLTGELEISANHAGKVASDAKGKTLGNDAAVGVSLGFTFTEESIAATLERSVTSTGDIQLSTSANVIHTSDALASASGAKGDDENQGGNAQQKTDQLRTAANQKSQDNSQRDSGTESKATATTANKDGSSQGDAVTVAAAIAVNIVESSVRSEVLDGLVVQAGGSLQLKSLTNSDASANADGSAVDGEIGIGAAVAINIVDSDHHAILGNSQVMADGLSIQSRMIEESPGISEIHSYAANATSGAGGSDVGVAGSLAINHLELDTSSTIRSGASIKLQDGVDFGSGVGPVKLSSFAKTESSAQAKPHGSGAQGDVGVGASVALNLTYFDTQTEIADSVQFLGGAAQQWTTEAIGEHQTLTTAENGAKASDVGVGGAVAVVVSKNKTIARVGTSAGMISSLGNANVHASHTNLLQTNVSSKASGSDAAVGASVGVVLIEDISSAELARNLNSFGNVSIRSQNETQSILSVAASTGGGDTDSDANTADEDATNQANQPNAKANGVNTVPSASETTNESNTKSSEESDSSGGSVGVAAAVAINALSIKNSAKIVQGADVIASGAIAISAPTHIVSEARADSSAVDISGDASVAAAVALIWVSLTNLAHVEGDSQISGSDVKVEAMTTGNQTNDYRANAFAIGGNTGDAAVAGVVAINVVDADTSAWISNSATIQSSGDLRIDAEHEMRIQAAGIAASGTEGAAVAMAVAINVIGLNELGESGGSNTIAGLGHGNGSGVHVEAEGNVDISATHTMAMFPSLDVPDSFEFPEDPLQQPIASIAVSGGASTGSFAGAGSAQINLLETTTYATVGGWSQITSNTLALESMDTTELFTLAGALGAAADGVGIGLGLDLNILHKDTLAAISQGVVIDIHSDMEVYAKSTETIQSYAATVGLGNSVGASGSIVVQVIETSTQAFIDDSASAVSGAQITTGGGLSIQAIGNLETRMVAGSVGVGSNAGIGASNTTLVHNDMVRAHVGSHASIIAGGDVSVGADSREDLVTISAAAGGASSVGVAGSAVVNVLNESTLATSGSKVSFQVSKGASSGVPELNFIAEDVTNVVSVGGSLSVGGSAGAGIGADVAKVHKDTIARIGADSSAYVQGDIAIIANSLEDFTSVAAGMAASGGASVSVDASVHVLDVTTKAYIANKEDPNDTLASIHAVGNIVIAADDQTQIDKVVGVFSGGSGAAIAAGAAVSTIDKSTEAFVGNGVKVTAEGDTNGTVVRTGRFSASYDPNQNVNTGGLESNNKATMTASIQGLQASGEIGLPNVEDAGSDTNGNSYAQDPSLYGQRVLGHETVQNFRGLSVTATNRDDIEDYSLSLAAASGAAVAVSAGVNVIQAKTRAYLGQASIINEDIGAANLDQSVNVTAGTDFQHVAFAGSLAVGGGVGIAPAVSVTKYNGTTDAYSGWNDLAQTTSESIVNARRDVAIQAHGHEDILLVGAGIGGGTVGIGAGVSVLLFDNQTQSAVGYGSTIQAGNNVVVHSTDDSDIDIIAGGGGGGMVGAGAGVGVLSITKNTQSRIDDQSIVDAHGGSTMEGIYTGSMIGDGNSFATSSQTGVLVQASSKEDVLHLAIAAAGGFVGVAGGVAVSLIDSDTIASIGDNTQINQSVVNPSSLQSVYVNAANEARITSFAGAIAGGAAAFGGAVEFGTLKNDTLAKVGDNADVYAANDVEVNALGIKDLDTYTFSGAGGVVGLTAAVSVWSIGVPLTKSYSDENGKSANALNGKDDASSQKHATDQAQLGRDEVASNLNDFGTGGTTNTKSNSYRLQGIAKSASLKLTAGAPLSTSLNDQINSGDVSAGTSASIGDFAVITAGQDISVYSNEDTEVDPFVGGFAGGLAGVGAAVGVYNISANSNAQSRGSLSAGNQVQVRAMLDEDVSPLAMAGTVGFVALGAAVVEVHDASTVQAAIGSVVAANHVDVSAVSDREFVLDTGTMATGGVAVGASFTRLTTGGGSTPSQVSAQVLGGSQIGQTPGKTVGSLNVEAQSTLDATNNTVALATGAAAISANFAFLEVDADVYASIGGGSQIDVVGGMSVKANGEHDATASVLTLASGGLVAGASLATATLEGNVQAAIFDAAHVDAASIDVKSELNQDLAYGRSAQAIAEAPSFAGLSAGTGTNATSVANIAVKTNVGEGAHLRSTTDNISIGSYGNHIATADAKSLSLGIGTAVGISFANAKSNGETSSLVEAEMNSENKLTIQALSTNYAIANAEATAGSIGASGAGAFANAETSPSVKAEVDAEAFVIARGTIDILATSNNKAESIGSGGAIGGIAGIGEVHTSSTAKGVTSTLASTNIDGHELNVVSSSTNIVTANGRSATGGLLAAGSGATAHVDSQPKVLAEANTSVIVDHDMTVKANLTNTLTSLAQSISVSGGFAKGGTSASTTSKAMLDALVSGSMTIPGMLEVHAIDNSDLDSSAGGFTLGLAGAAYGESDAVNKLANQVQAGIVGGIFSANNVSVLATETTNVAGQADGATIGGATQVGASVINDLSNNTRARIADDVFINSGLPGTGNALVQAIDQSTVHNTVDQLGISASGASGAASTHNSLTSSTQALLSGLAHVSMLGDIQVIADHDADVHVINVGASFGAGGAGSANAVVNVLDTLTQAAIEKHSKAQSGNNVLVRADSQHGMSTDTLSAAGGLLGGFGSTVVLNTYQSRTRAYVDDNSEVLAAGEGASLTIENWDSDGTVTFENLDGLGIIANSIERPADDFDGNGPLPPLTVRGEMTSGGLVGLNGVNIINVMNDQTEAFIASSNINTAEKTGNEVVLRAHSDQLLRSRTKSVAGGFAGVGGGSDRTEITSQTRAYISDNDESGDDLFHSPAIVYGRNIELESVSRERIDSTVESITGGAAAVGNAAFIANIDSTTRAFVRDSEAFALSDTFGQGDLSIRADDSASIDISVGTDSISGFVSAGSGFAFNMIENTVQAQVLGGNLFASNDTLVDASSDESIQSNLDSFGAGGIASMVGSVGINTIETTTEAYVGNGDLPAYLNNPLLPSSSTFLQNVKISASDHASITNEQGFTSVSGIVSAGAVVDSSNIRNRTAAEVGSGSTIEAVHNIDILATSDHHLDSKVTGFGGGLIGLTGAASYLSMGAPTPADIGLLLTEFLYLDQKNKSLEDQTDEAGITPDVALGIPDSPGSPSYTISSKAIQRVMGLENPSVIDALTPDSYDRVTSASILDAPNAVSKTLVKAGGNVQVVADHTYDVDQVAGADAGGLYGEGARTAVTIVRNQTEATLGSFNELGAGGDILIHASDVNASTDPIDLTSYGAALGIVAFGSNVADLSLLSGTTAQLNDHARILYGNSVSIDANQMAHMTSTVHGFTASGFAAAGSAETTPFVVTNTSAHIGDHAEVGVLRSVGSLSTKATSTNKMTNDLNVGAASVGGGVSHGMDSTQLLPTTQATIGDATIRVRDLTTIHAYGVHDLDSNIEALAVGAFVGKGAGKSNLELTGTVLANIADGADVETSGLMLGAEHQGEIEDNGIAIGGGLIGDIASEAIAKIDMDVQAIVGNAQIISDAAITISATSDSEVIATSGTIGVVGVGEGGSVAQASIVGQVSAEALAGAALFSGREISILSDANNSANATAQATSVGFANGAAAETKALVDVDTLSLVDMAKIEAGGDIRIESRATNIADTNSIGAAIGLLGAVGFVESEAKVEGSTRAMAEGDITSQDGFLRIQAVDEASHAIAQAKGAGGGIGVAKTATHVNASIQPSEGDNQAQVRARLAGNINAKSDIAVRAKSTDAQVSATVFGVSIAGAAAGAGTEANARLAQSLRSSIGDGSVVQSGRDIKVESLNNSQWSHAKAEAAGGAGLVGTTGTKAIAKSVGSVTSVVGDSAITADGSLTVLAHGTNLANATADGIAIGGIVGMGDALAEATAGNEAVAGVQAGAKVVVLDLVVEALGNDRAKSDVVGSGGGLVSDNSTVARSFVEPKVSAYLEQQVDVLAGQDIRVTAESRSEADSDSEANSFGGAAIGDSKSSVSLQPNVTSTIGIDATLSAQRHVTIEAITGQTNPTDGSGDSHANSKGSAGGIGTVTGTKAVIDATPSAVASLQGRVDSTKPTIEAGGNILLRSDSKASLYSDVNNNGFGLGASHGRSIVESDLTSTSHVLVGGSSEVIAAGNLTVQAKSFDRNQAHAEANAGAVVDSAARSESRSMINHDTVAQIDGLSKLIASNTLLIESLSDSKGISSSNADAGSAVVSANANAGYDEGDLEVGGSLLGVTIFGQTSTKVGESVDLQAKDIGLKAVIEQSSGESTSTSYVGGLADIDALSRVELYDDAKVSVGAGANIIGSQSVTLHAETKIIDVSSIADTNAGPGGATSDAIGHVNSDTVVDAKDGASIRTHALIAEALGKTEPGGFTTNAKATGGANGAKERGEFDPDRDITFDADVFLTSGNAVLIIGADGTVVERQGITFSPMLPNGNVDPTATEIVVNPILNSSPGTALFKTNSMGNVTYGNSNDGGGTVVDLAPLGVVRSLSTENGEDAFDITFDQSMKSVHIENHSGKTLVLSDIAVVNTSIEPEITIDTELIVDLQPGLPPVDIFGFDILQGFSPTDIEILQFGNVPTAAIVLTGLIDNPIGSTFVWNAQGDIQNGNELAIVRSNSLTIRAGDDIGDALQRVRIQLVDSEGRPAQSPTDLLQQPGFIGDALRLDIQGIDRNPSQSPFELELGLLQGHSIDLFLRSSLEQTAEGVMSYLVDVEVVPAPPIPYENHFRPDNGGPSSPLPIGIFGVGTSVVDTLYNIQKIESVQDVQVVGEVGEGVIGLLGMLDIQGTGTLDVEVDGSIDLTELFGDLRIGSVKTFADIQLTALDGNLIDVDNDLASDISGNGIHLQAPLGAIGSTDNILELDSSLSSIAPVNAHANSNIAIIEVAGTLYAGVIKSANGLVGLATVSGSIVDAYDDDPLNVAGTSILLMAQTGAEADLGEIDDPLEVCATGELKLIATGAIQKVKNLCDTNIQLIQSGVGVVSIASSGTINLLGGGIIIAPGGLQLMADDNIFFASDVMVSSGGLVRIQGGGNDRVDGPGATIQIDGDIVAAVIEVLGGDGNDQILMKHSSRAPTSIWANAGDDWIDGTLLDRAMVVRGGRGSDTILGSRLADQLYGDEGNDTFRFSKLGKRVVMGGTGNDRVELLDRNETLNLARIPDSQMKGIELIDLTGKGDNHLELNYQSVLKLSDETATLVVKRNRGDKVSLDRSWRNTGIERIGDAHFTVYRQGIATVKIQLPDFRLRPRDLLDHRRGIDQGTSKTADGKDTDLASLRSSYVQNSASIYASLGAPKESTKVALGKSPSILGSSSTVNSTSAKRLRESNNARSIDHVLKEDCWQDPLLGWLDS